MTVLVLRDLPRVAAIERQLALRVRDRLLDDEIDELPDLIDEASLALFGIRQRDTFYWALPASVRARFGRSEWDDQFEVLGQYRRTPNAQWYEFGLDLCCFKGLSLRCLEVFGRQLICALHGLHPNAVLGIGG